MILGMMAWLCVSGTFAQDGCPFNPRDFRLNVSQMVPSSYPSKMLSYGYSVTVRNDSAFVYLPYMGRVYRPVLNDDGLNFALPIEKFQVKTLRKGARKIEFSVRKMPVLYKFSLTVYPNGRADIFLLPDNAQGISYLADLDEEGRDGHE